MQECPKNLFADSQLVESGLEFDFLSASLTLRRYGTRVIAQMFHK